MLAPMSWEASIGPHVSGLAKFLNCPTGTDANACDIHAASTLGCVRQGLCFQLIEMEFMVNASRERESPRTLDGDNTDSIEEATTFSVECAQPVGAGQGRKLA